MIISLLIVQLLLFSPSIAMALQPHGGPEGIYLHLSAHIIFFISMVSLAVWIDRSRLSPPPAWKSMAMGAAVLAFWNAWAFLGHLLGWIIGQDYKMVFDAGQIPYVRINGVLDAILYVLRLDHLLYFPAIFLFYMGLRRLRLHGQGEER